jgi:hypothetical protein
MSRAAPSSGFAVVRGIHAAGRAGTSTDESGGELPRFFCAAELPGPAGCETGPAEENEGVTHGGEVGAGTRRERARARARRARTHRLGNAGLALFVGGPVLGFAIVVAGIVLAAAGTAWWPVAILAAVGGGLALHGIGLRMLLAAEDAREATEPAPEGQSEDDASPARTRPDS